MSNRTASAATTGARRGHASTATIPATTTIAAAPTAGHNQRRAVAVRRTDASRVWIGCVSDAWSWIRTSPMSRRR